MALVANNVYAYTSADDQQVFVKGSDLVDLGEWSSATTYSFRQAATYNGAYYVALQANTNTPPSGNISDDWSTLVLVRDTGSSGHTADEAYALAEEALETAIEVGQSGSNYAFELFVAGTNYTNNTAVSAIGTAVQQGSEFAYNLFLAGTNYTNTAAVAAVDAEAAIRAQHDLDEAAARVFGDGTTAQYGSEHAYNLFLAGTNYTNGQVATAVISANQSGSAYAFALYVAGTNFSTGYTDTSVAAEAAARAAADTLIRTDGTIFTVTQVGAEAAARAAADAQIQQQGSQFAVILRDQGTNYTNSQVSIETAARIAGDINTFNTGTAYTDQQIANLQISSGSASLALYWAGTNYTNVQVGAEAVTRANADAALAAADTVLSNAIAAEALTRANADANLLAAIIALQSILGISLQGTVAYYMAAVPRGKTDTKLTFINGVMTGVVASPYIWDDFSQYAVGSYPVNGTVTTPVPVTSSQTLIYGNAWSSYGTINTDIMTGTAAQDPINDYSLGSVTQLDQGYGWASSNGTFATPYVGQFGMDTFEAYAIGTVNTANPINAGTWYTQPAELFTW